MTEHVVCLQPFTVRRQARWNECDPAGIVHTTRYGDYCFSAIDLFLEARTGGRTVLIERHAIALRVCKLETEFLRSLRPGEAFEMEVQARPEGSTNLTFRVTGRGVDSDATLFLGTCVLVAARGQSAVAVPAELRTQLSDWQN